MSLNITKKNIIKSISSQIQMRNIYNSLSIFDKCKFSNYSLVFHWKKNELKRIRNKDISLIPTFSLTFCSRHTLIKLTFVKKMRDKGEPDDETTLALRSFGTNDSIFFHQVFTYIFFLLRMKNIYISGRTIHTPFE